MGDEYTSLIKTPKQFIIAVLAGFLVPIISIVLISQLVVSSLGGISKDDPAMSPEAVAKRLKPVGEVVMADDASAVKVESSGEEVVKAVCAACHATGVLNAPKIGDKKAWAARLKNGEATLMKNAINGIRQMPARGGNAALSDNEIARAVRYMANQSGVKLKEAAVQPAAATLIAGTGKTVFEANCAVCHVPGAANAPKFGDLAAWKPRLQSGVESLYKSAIGGKNAMPPKGGNATLADADVKAAVDYIVSQAK
ncbi:MAG TPA: c-type cytochrome [Burkholderiales bacterium]|nr:c-type cytochrome [Burkholderiales bacterium]